MKTEMMGMTV
jgi:hypothetical protein